MRGGIRPCGRGRPSGPAPQCSRRLTCLPMEIRGPMTGRRARPTARNDQPSGIGGRLSVCSALSDERRPLALTSSLPAQPAWPAPTMNLTLQLRHQHARILMMLGDLEADLAAPGGRAPADSLHWQWCHLEQWLEVHLAFEQTELYPQLRQASAAHESGRGSRPSAPAGASIAPGAASRAPQIGRAHV